MSLGLGLGFNKPKGLIYFQNKYSIDFDGISGYINVDTLAGTMSTGQAFTISVWFKGDGTNSGTGSNILFSAHNSSGNTNIYRLGINANSGGIFYGADLEVANTTVGSTDYDDIKWHHLVVTKSTGASLTTFYVDGVSIGTIAQTNANWDDAVQYSIGQEYDSTSISDLFAGNIDELALFDRELTQEEITRMCNTYYTNNKIQNGSFNEIGTEEVTNGDFSQEGAEQVTNGDFASDTTWIKGTGVTISGGSANFTGVANANIQQVAGLVTGKIYKIVFTVSNYVSGDIDYNVGGNTRQGAIAANGTYTDYVVSASGNRVFFQSDQTNGFVGSIDNVSCKEVGQDWTLLGTNATNTINFEANGVRFISVDQNISISQSNVLTVGKIYKLTCDVVTTTGAIGVDGAVTEEGTISMTNGFNEIYFTASETVLKIKRVIAVSNCLLSNLSIKEVGQNWTFGTGWSTDGTKAISDGTTENLDQDALITGKTYKAKVTVSNMTTGTLSYRLGGSSSNEIINISSNGEYTANGISGGVTLRLRSQSGFDGSVDNIVVQELKHDATNLLVNSGNYQSASPLITSTNSMEFDGADDYMKISDASDLQLAGQEASFTFWTKLDSLSGGDQKFLAKALTTGVDTAAYQIRTSNDDLIFQFFSSSWRTLTTSSFFTDTTNWVNVTVTIDSAYLVKMYKNGLEVFSGNIGYAIPSNSGELLFGARTPASPVNFLNGEMTEVGLYDRALTSLEVASLYNQGMPTNLLVNRNDYQSGNPTVFNTKQVDFDGTDDFLDLGSQSGVLRLAGSNGSISAWIKPTLDGDDFQRIVDKSNGGSAANGYAMVVKNPNNSSDGQIQCYISGQQAVNSVSVLAALEWSHVLWSWDGTNQKIYINGVLDATNSSSLKPPTDTTNMRIGSWNHATAREYNGEMSQIGIWNEALTADEVSSLYNHGLPVDLTTDQAAYESSSNLVGYWRMGSGTLDSYPLIADQTNATLGSELVTNGDFATDSDWNKGTGWTISNNKANFNTTSNSSLVQNLSITSGRTYRIQITGEITSGALKLTNSSGLGNDSSFSLPLDTVYTHDGGADRIEIRTINAAVGHLDSVSVKEVGGNPAIMTNQNHASDIENGSPYANTVQNGTFDTDSYWGKGTNCTIENGKANYTNAPSGQGFTQSNFLSIGKTYKITFTVSDYSLGSVKIRYPFNSSNTITSNGTYTEYGVATTDDLFLQNVGTTTLSIDNVTVAEVNTGLQGYWKMGSGINDEFPVIYDQTNPTNGSEMLSQPVNLVADFYNKWWRCNC